MHLLSLCSSLAPLSAPPPLGSTRPLSVMEINKLIEKELLEEAHLNLLSLRQDFQEAQCGEEKGSAELSMKEKDLHLLYRDLRDKVKAVVRDSSDPRLLLCVARIVQEEERREREGQPGGLAAAGGGGGGAGGGAGGGGGGGGVPGHGGQGPPGGSGPEPRLAGGAPGSAGSGPGAGPGEGEEGPAVVLPTQLQGAQRLRGGAPRGAGAARRGAPGAGQGAEGPLRPAGLGREHLPEVRPLPPRTPYGLTLADLRSDTSVGAIMAVLLF